MKTFPIGLLSRTSSVIDWKCQRARFWSNEYLGRGISKSTTSLALFTGTSIHDSLAAIATYHKQGVEVPIDTIATLAFNQIYDNLSAVPDGEIASKEVEDYAKEQGSLTEGIIRGFYRHVWPRLLDQYPTIVAIEQEVEYKLDFTPCAHCNGEGTSADKSIVCHECGGKGGSGFIFMAKPDLILEDREGEWHYIEFKSTSSKKDSWINSWDTAVQLHSSIKAVEQTMGRAPVDVIILGMYKGYESYGKQSSPFCYAYKKNGNPPFTKDQIEYGYKAGFKRHATWELPGGVAKWVEEMPEAILADQFPMTAPIYINDSLVDRFFAQRLIREKEITYAMTLMADGVEDQATMDRVFPQKFDVCQPSYGGYTCEYKKLCFGHVKDPLQEGFQLREPHHERDRKQYESKEA